MSSDTVNIQNGIGEIADGVSITLTDEDRAVLHSLEPVVDAVAVMFGEHCEVLLHSLEDLSNSVVKIANGHVTGRSVGSPVTDLAIKTLKNAEQTDSDVVGAYYSTTRDGRKLRSVTALIRNGSKPIGLLCVNMDMSAPLLDILRTFVPGSVPADEDSPEHFVMSTDELVHKSVETAITEMNKERQVSPASKNKRVVGELFKQGIFDVKGAVDIVARELGVSRYTIYNYLREIRN